MIRIISMRKYNLKIYTAAIYFCVMTLVYGCAGNYGHIRRDPSVSEAFVTNQLPTDYRYYYNGVITYPYAIVGIDPQYFVDGKTWRNVDPASEEFKDMTKRVWQDYEHDLYGAHILDPDGKGVGIWFSSVRFVSIRFAADNRVVISLDLSTYLGGPEDGSGDIRTPE